MSAQNVKVESKRKYRAMPIDIKNDFFKVLSIPTVSTNESLMTRYLYNRLDEKNLYYTTDHLGNIYVVKQTSENHTIFPCIVSHLDTVHQIVSMNIDIEIYKDKDNNCMVTSKQGVGGDDKCGIFACLYLLDILPNLKVVFFTKEEYGLEGSSQCDETFFDDVGYIVQLDRWGNSDFICQYSGELTVSEEFLTVATPVMNHFGYTQASGLITDSINLWNDGIGISCVNVSCGYYKHHTDKEYIDLNEFYNSLLFTEQLFYELGEYEYPSMVEKALIYTNFSKYDNAINPQSADDYLYDMPYSEYLKQMEVDER